MYYQEIADKVLGQYSPHRTLRTVFDYLSDEWTRTTIDKKLEILEQMLDTGEITLGFILNEYRHYYTEELSNKAYVVDAIEDSFEILLEHSLKRKSQ
ncbi:hypothetical protein [Kaistella sp.]|uniref:hypothetical protein n=1 Tax=Kaistella sp. TaxID=2782235 RepID=UPI002F9203BD